MIKAIMACDRNGGVGLRGQLPWPHIERDFRWFMDRTLHGVIVMGRNTWNDPQLGHPMPDRVSYVVTSTPGTCSEAHGHLSADLHQSIRALESEHPGRQVWVIGGVGLIQQILPVIDQFYLSRIPGDFECDCFLPMSELDKWAVLSEESHPDVTFQILRNPLLA